MLSTVMRTARIGRIIGKRMTRCLYPSMIKQPSAFIPRPFSMQPTIATRNYVISTEGEDIASKIDDLSPGEYNRISNEYLELMIDSLEELAETVPEIDCELSQGVLTLTVPQLGSYVINKQPPNKQIWLSSPVSGPKRFDMIEGKWITLRDGSSLTELVKGEVEEALGVELPIDTEY